MRTMSDINLSLIHIEEGALEPLEKVANNLINKVANAMGWLFSTIDAKKNAQKSIIEEIKNREDINPIERLAIIGKIETIKRQFTNQYQIMDKAIHVLNEKSKPEELDDDWVTTFFDLCKNVSEESMQHIWAKILAGESEHKGTYNFRFLKTIADIQKEEAESIKYISKYINFSSFNNKAPSILYNSEFLKYSMIKYEDIILLEDIGIVKIEKVTLPDDLKFTIGQKNYICKRKEEKKETENLKLKLIPPRYECCRFTNIGEQFLNIINIEPKEDILNMFYKVVEKDYIIEEI